MGYLTNSGTGFLKDAVTTVSNVKSYLINKTGYLVDAIRVGISDFGQRVLDDGGTLEASAEAAASYREITKDIYDQASLVLFPSGYKDNLLYSHKPVDGSGDFAYTRGTDTATRVGADGYIKKERANLLLQSNQFDTTWNLSGGSTLNQNAVGIDNIPNTAWTFTKDSTFDGIKQNISKSGINTFSVYAKKIDSSVNELILRINVAGGNRIAIFDLSNGTKVSMTSDSSAVHYDIQKAGNGWYRCSFVVSGTIANVDIRMDYNQTGTGSMLVQNAQLEEGLVATPYIETTTAPVYEGLTDNLPRIDYTGGTPSILLEPSRTNLLPYSEYMLGSNWDGSPTTLTPVLSDTLSPQGVKNAYRITKSGSENQLGSLVSITNGNTYTGSIYIRKVSGSDTAVLKDVNNIGTIIDITTQWKRFSVTATANSTNGRLYISPRLDGDVIEVYGAQLEEGSYPTSYIPTYNSSATRAADDLNDLSVSENNEGTFYFETKDRIFENESSNKNYLGLIESSSGNYFRFRGASSVILIQSIGFGSNISFNPSGASLTKYLYKWDGTTIKVFVDGVERGSVSQTAAFNPDTFRKAGGGFIGFSSNLKQFLIFPTALSDADCEALTTL